MSDYKEIIKPPNDFHAGTDATEFKKAVTKKSEEYPQEKLILDLSDVVYMDSFTFRVVFDFLPIFSQVIPPKSQHIIHMYNLWLDGKKGLSKK